MSVVDGEARLGLATTRELLIELEARGASGALDVELSRHREALRQLDEGARRLRMAMPPVVLDYRAVDS